MKQSRSLWRWIYQLALIAVSLSAPLSGTAVAQPNVTLPSGPSSLQEDHDDWLIVCVQERDRRCVLLQGIGQEGHQFLAIELAANADGETATGALVLPIGMALDAAVTFRVDDRPAWAPLNDSICAAGRCIVPFNVDAASLATLRAGQTFTATAEAAGNAQTTPLSISLKGFSSAFDRVADLTK